MKSSGLIIAAVVLAALSGVLYWSNHHPPSDNTAKASIDAPPQILSLKQEDISNLQIKKKGGEELDLAKGDSGKWQITAPKPLGADQEAVSACFPRFPRSIPSASWTTKPPILPNTASRSPPSNWTSPPKPPSRKSFSSATTLPPAMPSSPSSMATRASSPSPPTTKPAWTKLPTIFATNASSHLTSTSSARSSSSPKSKPSSSTATNRNGKSSSLSRSAPIIFRSRKSRANFAISKWTP